MFVIFRGWFVETVGSGDRVFLLAHRRRRLGHASGARLLVDGIGGEAADLRGKGGAEGWGGNAPWLTMLSDGLQSFIVAYGPIYHHSKFIIFNHYYY